MNSEKKSDGLVLRTIVVFALALFVLIGGVADVRRLWHPIGHLGYGTNADGLVTGVDAGSPASSAGLEVGDRLDIASMSPAEQWALVQIPLMPSSGEKVSFGVFHHDERRVVTLVSQAEHVGAAEVTAILTQLLTGTLFIVIGIALVLLKPSATTWGFYLFCVGFAPFSIIELGAVVPSPYIQLWIIVLGILASAGGVGVLVFAVRFLQESVMGWRSWIERLAPFVFVVWAALGTWGLVTEFFLGRPSESLSRLNLATGILISLIVLYALIDTYARRRGAERQRIRWVVVGFGVALAAQSAFNILSVEAANSPQALRSAVQLLTVAAPIAVAYAIVKHRVIDINFVISRTVVYGALTTLFVGAFALIDWVVGRVLAQTQLAVIVDIGAAVASGFWLNTLHNRIDRFVDSVLFRRRHAAERRLARVAAGLPHAASLEVVDDMLVNEPVDAFELTSAALFRRDESGRFVLTASHGWPSDSTACLDTKDTLIVHLQGERAPLRLSDVRWPRTDLPAGSARPLLAVPVIVRHLLDAVVLYGPHRGGEDFDPDELRALTSIAVAAGAAYDHLEADALRREVEEMKRLNDALRLTLQRHGLPQTG